MRPADRIVCIGVHILDIHGWPISEIPAGQGGARIDSIRLSAAGTGAGTAVDLAKLGADVVTFGCVGTDEIGDFILDLLRRHGVDARVSRTDRAQSSATILPIRPNGERPALHVVGANAFLELTDVDRHTVKTSAVVLLGGPDRMGAFLGEPSRTVLGWARAAGVATAMDVLDARPSRRRDEILALLPLVDHLLPNEEQLCDLFDQADPLAAARLAIEHGATRVAVSLGADGCLVVDADHHQHIPGREVDVVDTTGCGDALTAGYLRGLTLGCEPVEAAELGVVAASLVAGGVGSDAGIVDLDSTRAAGERLGIRRPTRSF
ncbi:MAG: sugar kinase [Ilumatobacteraceae bacterium]